MLCTAEPDARAVVQVDEVEKHYRFEDRTYSQIVVKVHLRRLYWRYLMRYLTVLVVLVGISWATFAIDPRKVVKRGLVVAGTFVALVGMQFVAQEGSPRVSYLTRLDKFLYGAFLFVSSVMLQTIIVFILAVRKRRLALAYDVDQWAAIGYASAFVLFVLGWLAQPTYEYVLADAVCLSLTSSFFLRSTLKRRYFPTQIVIPPAKNRF